MAGLSLTGASSQANLLIAIKLIHTIVWAVFAGCVLAIPVAAWRRLFRPGAVLSAVVLLECGILAVNGGQCPLTNLASHLTADRADNFDIYLPVWLAHFNKLIFGVLFTLGEALLLVSWWRSGFRARGLPSGHRGPRS